MRRLHTQKAKNTCAVAALRTVLDLQYHLRIPEVALEALGTEADRPIKTHGTTNGQFRRMVQRASAAYVRDARLTCKVRRNATLDDLTAELTRDRYPVVTVYNAEADELHAVVVLRVTRHQVRVFDPSPHAGGEPQWMTHAAFLAWWTDPKRGITEYAVVGRRR